VAGLKAHLFGALLHSLQKVSDRDWYCSLLLDEISVRKNDLFNLKHDCIEGVEDYETERTCNIGNHAPVFKFNGLRQKWKQPVAYYFSHGSTKAKPFGEFLDKLLGAYQNAGLPVVVTTI
jgi:hypothetical protein